MTTLPIHDVDTGPSGSQQILKGAQQALGFVPNLYGALASSPATLEAYTTLAQLQESKGAFDETERQILFLSISATNTCEYCVAAHTTISKGKRVPDDVVLAVRRGTTLADPKHEALRKFATAVVEQRGLVGEAALAEFRSAGYEARHVLEVVLAVAFKTISNYTNHIAETPLDQAFQPQAWSAEVSA